MMKLATCVVLFLASVTLSQGRQLLTEQSVEKFEKPWFCHDLDCPKYTVLNKTDKYEIRDYEAATYAATSVESIAYSIGITTGFKRLFDYISGENTGNKKIEMTSPVVVQTIPGAGAFCKSNFTTYFYVPYNYQDNPPQPTNSEVLIVKEPRVTVAVLGFGGYVEETLTISHKLKLLREALQDDAVSYIDTDNYFVLSYDPPFRLQHRHNEVVIPISRDDSSTFSANDLKIMTS